MIIDKMEKDELTYHVPVLLKESVDGMNIQPDGTYVDVTFGGAGHSREILSRLGEGGRLLGFDQDEDAERNIVNDTHFIFVRSNFRYLHNFLRYHNIEQVDAILADLGVSSHHFDDSERGFSFRFDGALDMRMNKRAGMTAADIVNTYDEERLANILYLYGELKNSRKLASVIVKARSGQNIRTIGEFLEVIKPLFGREREKKELAKVFQALRIEVNQEMEALKEMLLLTGITIVNVEDDEYHDKYQQLRLTAEKIGSQNVSTQNTLQRGAVFLLALFCFLIYYFFFHIFLFLFCNS